MQQKFFLKTQKQKNGKKRIYLGFIVVMAAMLFCSQAMAFETEFFGRPLFLNGYINQGVAFGVAGDHYDTMQGFQQVR